MGIKIGIFLVGTLCSTLTLSLHVQPGSIPLFINYGSEATGAPIERYGQTAVLSGRTLNETRNHGVPPPRGVEGRMSFGREIIEISDPTTDSTLHSPHYPLDCTDQKDCEVPITSDTTPMPTFRPYSQEELNGFLKKYVEHNGQIPNTEQPTNKLANLYMDEAVNVLEGDKETGKSQEKSKSWQLMQAQNKNPYDDRNGWVTLEPVPWSASQIQKWEPNKRPPEIPHWSEDPPETTWNRPSPSKRPEKPWNKNTYEYKPSSKPWNSNKYNNKPASNYADSWGAESEIITDNRPSQFPHESSKPSWYDRPQTEVTYQGGNEPVHHPYSHMSDGDGKWVLLSSTKGYSVPQRSRAHQRSLFITGSASSSSPSPSPSVKSHRSVRLTVLPPLNGTMNTTTIHNGLVEVEQTMQTVDEAHREHVAKMLKLETLNPHSQAQTAPRPQSPPANRRQGTAIKVYPARVAQNQARNNAMLAAVGAGMIPATVAMMLPMVLGRRRRSLRIPHQHIVELHQPHFAPQ